MIPPPPERRSQRSPTGAPPATEWEQVRQSTEAARLYRQLDLQASVQAWELTRSTQPFMPERAARRDGHLAYVRRQHYEMALHGAHAARLTAQAQVQARVTHIRPGPTPIKRAVREASVRDPFAATWGADPLNREIALAVLTMGTGRALMPATASLSRSQGRLTYREALQMGGEFVVRGATDAGIQYGGGLGAHEGNWEEAVNEVNITSIVMAGLPGDALTHSIRNNLVSNSLEWKLNTKTKTSFEPMTFDQQGLLNFGQKVVIGVGVDYATSRLNAAVQPLRGGSASAIKRSKDPHIVWLHRQRLRYLNAMTRSTDGFKVSGEAASNLLEDQIKAAYAADQQP